MAKCLAIASSERDFAEIESLARKRQWESDSVAILEDHSPKSKSDYLKKQDWENVEVKSGFFARNWYKFDKAFEKRATYKGISLGFVNQNDLAFFFKKTLLLLKEILRALEEEKPETVVANRRSLAGMLLASIAKEKNLKGLEFFETGKEKRFKMFPHFSLRKLSEIRKRKLQILNAAFDSGRIQGKKTVFVRSRGYLGELETRLRSDKDFNVVSLDGFLPKRLLNPMHLLGYLLKRAKEAKRFRQMFKDFEESPAFGKSFVFEGIPFGEAVKLYFPRAFERDWPEFLYLIDCLSSLFEKSRPDLVVLWEDFVPFERICALLARKAKAKSLVVQHGMIKPVPEKGDWIRGYVPLTADKIAVWGELFKKGIENHGVSPSKVVVTGSPRFDALAKKRVDAGKLKQGLGLRPEEKLVVIAPSKDLDRAEMEAILQAIAKQGKFRKKAVVKIRPIETIAMHSWMQGKAILRKDIDLPELLNASDAVVIKWSTVGLEAMLLGKPVIVFKGLEGTDNAYCSTNAVLRAENEEQLAAALETAIGGKGRKDLEKRIKKFAFERAFRLDGKATERVANIAREMAGLREMNQLRNVPK